MKTFLTLLTVITSLSAYTLVGVHARCPNCPATVGGVKLTSKCISGGTTSCKYKTNVRMSPDLACSYNNLGYLNDGSDTPCAKYVKMGTTCPGC
ncbi:hypothetical protein BDN67DRAFT_973233 [Paxillus ammoniavirescens]|nr:hypothetical protein BDN67DRAFT_973233 [Paxillus ammoniavirescens]